MTKHNAENERIKRKYFAYLKDAKQHSEPTVDAAAKALSRFEEYNRYRDFKAFHLEQAIAFKRHLAEQTGQRSGEKLSKATLHATLKQLRAFFLWLAGQPGYKARLQYSDADYFNLSEKDARIATAQRERKAPTLEQVKHVIETMPEGSEIERRNRVLVAFTLLTGARDSAIASMKLKHIDLIENCVHQDAREVKTKFSKTFTTYFFPVGDGIREIVAEWVRFLREEKLWGNDDPLFPATRIAIGATRQFEVAGLEREHWSSAEPIRKVFREAFGRAGLPYFHPHSLRKTLARLGEEVCNSPEEFKAWSQNLGHEQAGRNYPGIGCDAAVKAARSGSIAEAIVRRLQSAGAASPEAL
jgi:integrase